MELLRVAAAIIFFIRLLFSISIGDTSYCLHFGRYGCTGFVSLRATEGASLVKGWFNNFCVLDRS